MLLDPLDHVAGSILAYGDWEPDVAAVLRDRLRPGDCFVDIGANLGYFSLLASSIVGPSGRVLAFEPNPNTGERLIANIRRSGYCNIDVCAACCSAAPGRVTLYLNDPNNLGACSLSGHGQTIEVESICADSEICKLPKAPALIKMDVEGAEVLALRGMHATLAAGPTLVLELDDKLLRRMGFTVADLQSQLAGFSMAVRGTMCIAEPSTIASHPRFARP